MEKILKPIVLTGLQRINTEINLCKKREIFDIFQLVNFFDVVQIQIQEFQRFNCLKAFELANLVLRKIKGSENW